MRQPSRSALPRDRGHAVDAAHGVRRHIPTEIVRHPAVGAGAFQIESAQERHAGEPHGSGQAPGPQGGIAGAAQLVDGEECRGEERVDRGRSEEVHPGRTLVRGLDVDPAPRARSTSPERRTGVAEAGLGLPHVVRRVESDACGGAEVQAAPETDARFLATGRQRRHGVGAVDDLPGRGLPRRPGIPIAPAPPAPR